MRVVDDNANSATVRINHDEDDDVVIRRYGSSDLPQVKQLFIDGMKDNGTPETYIQGSLATDLSSIEETYFAGRGDFFVMVRSSDATIVGTVGLQDLSTIGKPNDPKKGEEGRNLCELRRMSIHSSERRKGRGRQLIERFVSHARERGFEGIVLSTGAWMETAISFYLSMGFRDMGREHYNHAGTSVTIANLEYKIVG